MNRFTNATTLQKRYEGFLNTPVLWQNAPLLGLQPFKIPVTYSTIPIAVDSNLRLGKYVERLVTFQLNQTKNISILAENIQIQQHKHILGELDCILLKDGKPVHLEIVYKFYVYDPKVGTSEIAHCIGPNRKDSLIEKLEKLRDKQLPLLKTEACAPYLKALQLDAEQIAQEVYFKAQLFLPYTAQKTVLKTLHPACVVGYYVSQIEFQKLIACKFYRPTKKDWLITPHTSVNWIDFNAIKVLTAPDLEQHYSVLLWVKHNTGILQKIFLVWW